MVECPRWRDGRLYFSDMHGGIVGSVTPDGTVTVIAEITGTPAGLGWLPDGTLLVVSQEDRKVYRVDEGQVSLHSDLSDLTESPLNDMWVSPTGHAYVGGMGFDIHAFIAATEAGRTDGPAFAYAQVFQVRPDGSVGPACDVDFMFPNGIVGGLTPRQVLVAESFGLKISSCDVADDGTLSGHRLWAQLDFAPDGIALDAEGALWVADPTNDRIVRVAEGGEVLQELPTGAKCLSAALGGPGGDTLFVCTTPVTDHERAVQLRDSAIKVVQVAVQAP